MQIAIEPRARRLRHFPSEATCEDVVSRTLGQGVPNSKAEVRREFQNLATLTIRFSAHNDISLGYLVSKALGGTLLIAMVESYSSFPGEKTNVDN